MQTKWKNVLLELKQEIVIMLYSEARILSPDL